MLKLCSLPLFMMVSISAFADVSFHEKKNRVEFLEELSNEAVSMNIEAYRRELEYEKQNVSLEKRAENETNLLAEKIKLQIQRAYEASIENKTHDEAVEEVKSAIDKDLELVAPELREEIRELSYTALENSEKGISHFEADLSGIEKSMLKGVEERSNYLNQEGDIISKFAKSMNIHAASPSTNNNLDADASEYASKARILEALTSDNESTRWVSTSNMSIKGENIVSADARINIQVKVNFLGVELDAGPTIAFKRQFKTTAIVMAEGLKPILLPDGSFDFLKRDENGKPLMKNGKNVKRFANFTCDAELDFESEYTGGGGFSVVGAGGSTTVVKQYVNSVNLTSRRIAIPDHIDGKTVSLKYLSELCHKDFLKAKITNTMNVSGSLNMMMKNTIAGLRFSHPKTKCMTDNHCANWFNKELIAVSRIGNVARCVEEGSEKYRSCEARGLKGQNCAIFDNKGKRLSDGKFEFTCDTGLKCVKVQEEGWLQGWSVYKHAKGKCVPK